MKILEELAVVELVDATDPGVHNDNDLTSATEVGLIAKVNSIEESSSQFTVSIKREKITIKND